MQHYKNLYKQLDKDRGFRLGFQGHITYPSLSKVMVDLFVHILKNKRKKNNKISNVYDPCCGYGMLLSEFKQTYTNEFESKKLKFFCQDINADVIEYVQKENPDWETFSEDSLVSERYKNRKFDYLIFNPPFGGRSRISKIDSNLQFLLKSLDHSDENSIIMSVQPANVCYSIKKEIVNLDKEFLMKIYFPQ